MVEQHQGRDILVIGGSAGALEPLKVLLACLPPDFGAAVFVVIHISPDSPRLLGQILGRAGVLPVVYAADGEPIRTGRVYLAPPDQHLLLKSGQIELSKGPRENRFRPAIDPLFRSAAQTYGARVAALLLSGGLNDGSYGMLVVKQHGGATLVQDPREAEVPEMVQSALECAAIDQVLPVAQICDHLVQLTREARLMTSVPATNNEDNDPDQTTGLPERPKGMLAPVVCPECGGALWETQHRTLLRYQCHEGHAYTAESLLPDQRQAIEAALWSAVRALDENAEVLRRMARKAAERNFQESATTFGKQAGDQAQRADLIRRLLAADASRRRS